MLKFLFFAVVGLGVYTGIDGDIFYWVSQFSLLDNFEYLLVILTTVITMPWIVRQLD